MAGADHKPRALVLLSRNRWGAGPRVRPSSHISGWTFPTSQSRVNRTRPRCPAFQWPVAKATRAWAGGPLYRASLCVPRGRLGSTAPASLCPGKLEGRRLPPVLVPLVLSGPASPAPPQPASNSTRHGRGSHSRRPGPGRKVKLHILKPLVRTLSYPSVA